jgi:hypothetical protein
MRAAIDMSNVLGVDNASRPLWQDRIDHLAPFPTATVTNPQASTQQIVVFTAQEYPSYFPGSTNPLDLYRLCDNIIITTRSLD